MDTFISQQPKAIESRHRCQMIAMTVFYNQYKIYKQADFFVAQIFKKL